ncbi:MAG TPA: hypothetical protein VGW58_14655, partial [Pyrinomonadaceae bacterium]|nr:hypothetical protein [Pyrinomonadaceae bacterium]
MKFLIRTTILAMMIQGFSVIVEARAWRSIVPLQSTRNDVERLLGPPPPPENHPFRGYVLHKGRSIYSLDEGEIYIVFAEQDSPSDLDCVSSISEGTVLWIGVSLKKGLKTSELGVDLKSFNKFDPSEPRGIGYDAFIDEQDGFMLRRFRGMVENLWYFP